MFNNQKIVYLEDSDFERDGTLRVDTLKPVMIMIYGESCPHCHDVAPDYSSLASEYDGAMFAAICGQGQLADNALSARLQEFLPDVVGFPTFVLYRNGKYIKTYRGRRTKSGFRAFIEN